MKKYKILSSHVRSTFLFLSVFLSATFFVQPAFSADYCVIVSVDNTYSADNTAMKQMVKRLFLANATQWPGGVTARVFARKKTNPAQTIFEKQVLNMSTSELNSHWARQKQTTGATPPRSVGSNSILMRLMARDPGSFSILAKEGLGPLPPTVKVLFEFSD